MTSISIVSTVQVVIQMFTSTLSMICSATLSWMIIRSSSTRSSAGGSSSRAAAGKLNTPYKRYVLGMCVGDMSQSLGLIIGPFMVPKEMNSVLGLARGNAATCDVDGSLIVFGILCTCLYLLGLMLSYLCVIKYNIRNEIFLKRWDKMVHFVALGYPFSCCIYLVLSKSFNATNRAGLCLISQSPMGCIGDECRGYHYRTQAFGLVFIAGLMIIMGNLTCMAMIVHHVIQTEQIYCYYPTTAEMRHVSAAAIGNTYSTATTSSSADDATTFPQHHQHCPSYLQRFINVVTSPCRFMAYLRTQDPSPLSPRQQQEEDTDAPIIEVGPVQYDDDNHDYDLDYISQTNSESVVVYDVDTRVHQQKQRRKWAVTSALFYTGSIVLTYLLPIICGFYERFHKSLYVNPALSIWIFMFFPLGGVMYIYAHTWNKIRIVQKRERGYSCIRAFIAVIIAGAEIPKRQNSRNGTIGDNNHMVTDHEEQLFGMSTTSSSTRNGAIGVSSSWRNMIRRKCEQYGEKKRFKKKAGYVIRRRASDLLERDMNPMLSNSWTSNLPTEEEDMQQEKKQITNDKSDNDNHDSHNDQNLQSARLQVWLKKRNSRSSSSPTTTTTTSELFGFSTAREIHQKYSISVISAASISSESSGKDEESENDF